MTLPCLTSLLLPILILSGHPLVFQWSRRVLGFLSVLGVPLTITACISLQAEQSWVSIALPACQPLVSQTLTVST